LRLPSSALSSNQLSRHKSQATSNGFFRQRRKNSPSIIGSTCAFGPNFGEFFEGQGKLSLYIEATKKNFIFSPFCQKPPAHLVLSGRVVFSIYYPLTPARQVSGKVSPIEPVEAGANFNKTRTPPSVEYFSGEGKIEGICT